MSLCAY